MAIIKGCIFDLDGVLVDTAKYHYQPWRKLAKQLNFEFTEEENESLKGVNRLDSLKLILGWAGVNVSESLFNELADKKNSWYVEMIEKLNPSDLLPGVLEFLNELKTAGYRIALGSASKNAHLILNKMQIVNYFDAIVDGSSVSESKPNPAVFLKAARLIGLNARDCIVLEDAVSGVEAAKNAGMKVIGIGEAEILTGADIVISGIDEMNIKVLVDLEGSVDL